MMNRICVSLVDPVGGHGGALHLYDFGLAEHLGANGVDVTLYTCAETPPPEPGAGFSIVYSFIGIWGRANKLKRFVRYLRGMLNTIGSSRRQKARVVHFQFFAVTLLEAISVIFAKLAGLKIVITAHDVESFANDHNQFLSTWVYRSARKVIAHNDFSRGELVSKIRVAADKIAVIPHGNYLTWLGQSVSKEEARRTLKLPSGVPILLLFGAIKPVKRLDLLLRAMPLVLSEIPDVHLVVAGTLWKGGTFDSFQELIDEAGLGSHVITDLRGHIPDDDAENYYRAADLVVLPYDRVYQSGVLLMAMSYAQPVLVSNVPGMLELVEESVTGFTFETGNVESLAEKLKSVLKADALRETVAKRGYQKVTELYDWKRIGRLTADAYREVLGESRQPDGGY